MTQVEQLKEARSLGDAKKVGEIITEMLRPEAKELIEMARKDISTKDGYGTIMKFLPSTKPYERQFLRALEIEGYPSDTIDNLKEIFQLD